jgi:hypothetical protein
MAFLDNSGDIILDAVLTDLGRKRLAAGRFNISKFALGDEEINYELWDPTDGRGSHFYDLQILQTPILEAFTSDQSLMKSRLVSLPRTSILYMPIFKLNSKQNHSRPNTVLGGFSLLADDKTHTVGMFSSPEVNPTHGYMHGEVGQDTGQTTHICIDQGIDSTEGGQNITSTFDTNLLETAFLVKCDSRLLRIGTFRGTGANGGAHMETHQFLDDDAIATYYIVQGQNGNAIVGPRADSAGGLDGRNRHLIDPSNDEDARTTNSTAEMFAGPLGNILRIVPKVSQEILHSDALFDELGSHETVTKIVYRGADIDTYKFIDTTITVQGVTTGYSLDIPIRIIKGKTFSST